MGDVEQDEVDLGSVCNIEEVEVSFNGVELLLSTTKVEVDSLQLVFPKLNCGLHFYYHCHLYH